VFKRCFPSLCTDLTLKFRGIYQFVVVIAAVDSVDNPRPPYSCGVAAVGHGCGQPETTRGGFGDDGWGWQLDTQVGGVFPRLVHTLCTVTQTGDTAVIGVGTA
jgi:hypothetical protein